MEGNLKPLKRLDQVLVERGLMPSRSRAADAISRGTVLVKGLPAIKPSQKVQEDWLVEIHDPADGFVSRAALKLVAAMETFEFDAFGRHALDIGASTGGFSQVLLEAGAAHVFAVDVGHDQLHPLLSQHQNFTHHEGLNIRAIEAHHVSLSGNPPFIDAIVCDVSFISLKLALPKALSFAQSGTWAAILIKPQFEVGKDLLGKGGIVREEGLAERTAQSIVDWMNAIPGWDVVGLEPSPIAGGSGNKEFIMGAQFHG